MSSTKRKAPPVRIAQPQTTRNAKPMAKARINQAKTTVVSVPKHTKSKKKAAGEAIEISSDEEEEDDVEEEDADLMDEDEPEAATEEVDAPQTNGHVNGTKKSADAENDDNEEDDDADHEPTFGDLVREHETVDVTTALSQLNPDAAEATQNGAASKSTAAPTLSSLGHLLNAALRSGDDANLEVCFNTTTDAVWVRNTIQRLDPSLAGTLLQKLATRIHRRPGRAHTLVGWVQWTLITHGGALLANQAGVTRALQELHRVLEERARGLNSLLLLKGKLDMLEAQMQLRRLQRQGASANTPNGGHSGIATVGGRAGGSSKALDGVGSVSRRGAGRRRGGRGARGGDEEDEDEFVATYHEEDDVSDDEDEAGQILVNGAGIAGESFIADSDEEALDEDDDEDSEGDEDEDADDDDDVEDMDEDDVAEEDEVDFDDVDDEDDDDDEDDEDDAAAAPPPKLQKKSGGAFSKRR